MGLIFRSMVVVPNRFKLWSLFLILLLASCKEEVVEADFESRGFGLIDNNVSVSALKLDSILYANGASLWMINGSIQTGVKTRDFRIICTNNPTRNAPEIISSSAPLRFKDSIVECVITEEFGIYKISWKTDDQRIFLKSSFTSEH